MKITVYIFLFTLSSLSIAQKRVQVGSNRTIELINMLAVQNAAALLKDTLTNPWYTENSVLMRKSFYRFRRVQQLPIFKNYQQLEECLGTGTYLLSLYYTEVPQAKRRTDVPAVITEAVSPNRDSVMQAIDTFFVQLNQLYIYSLWSVFGGKPSCLSAGTGRSEPKSTGYYVHSYAGAVLRGNKKRLSSPD